MNPESTGKWGNRDWRASQAWLAFHFSPSVALIVQANTSQAEPASDLASLEVRLAGRVQGVGFRYFVHESSRRLGLTGYVMNLRDGSVRAYAEGPRESLERFLSLVRQGPRGASVREVRVVWGTATGQHTTFTIESTR